MFTRGRFIHFWLVIVAMSPSLGAQEIEVIGQLKLEAFVTPEGNGGRIAGRVRDELAHVISGNVRFAGTDVGYPELLVTNCKGDGGSAQSRLITDSNGEYCARIEPLPAHVWVLAEATHYKSAKVEASVDEAQLTPPQFINAPEIINKHITQEAVVEVQARIFNEKRTGKLQVLLSCPGSVVEIGTTEVRGNLRQRFAVTPTRDMEPGYCRWEAQLNVPTEQSLSSFSEVLIRDQAELTVVDQKTDATFGYLTVVARSASSSPVDGLVEVRRGDTSLATLTLSEQGSTAFELPLEATAQTLEISYRPSGPAWLAGPPVQLTIPARPAVLPWWLFHIAGLVFFFAWVVYRWMGVSSRLTSLPPRTTVTIQHAVPVPRSSGAIRGLVHDTHTHTPLALVQVTLMRLSASHTETLSEQTTDSEGRFSFEHLFSAQELLSLRFHRHDLISVKASVTAAAFSVTMTSTRRAAMDHFIAWARNLGRPWHVASSPTTGHVKRIAERKRLLAVQQWADEVERAAYGPHVPTEGEIAELGKTPPLV
jgi:5-hydroxyisourate hydrolase-like protein (transthyretin family)